MESSYILSTTDSSTTKKVNVSHMDSLTGGLSSIGSELDSSINSSGFKDSSALKVIYGSTTKDKIETRKKEIKLTFKAIRASECVDLLFLVDCTGSMDPYIEQVKRDITVLHEALKTKHVDLDMTFGFIRYTDFDQGSTRCSELKLTRSTKEFVEFVSLIKANGGDDGPEDVFGGMSLIKASLWRTNSTRVVVHIADAPCHGTEYHNFAESADNHPSGDPNGITLDSLLMDIIGLNINYYFGHINLSWTGKMVDKFDTRIKQLSGGKACINSFDSKDTSTLNEKLFKVVETSIHSSLSHSTAQLLKIEGSRNFTIDSAKPNFECLPFVPMLQIKFKMPSSILDCLDKSYEMKHNEATVAVKMSPSPFAQGALRLAYYGVDEENREIVLKQSKFLGERHNSKKRYFEAMECQTVAARFALDFNKQVKSQDIKFTVAKVLQVKYSETPIYFSVEPFIEGTYEKFNSNSGWLKSDDKFSDILQTFSHWTYHESKGSAIVVDIQGVKTERDSIKQFLLTDPAIHSKDILRFGSTNLGKPGIIKFFQTHKCNIHCNELGLTTPDFSIKSSTFTYK